MRGCGAGIGQSNSGRQNSGAALSASCNEDGGRAARNAVLWDFEGSAEIHLRAAWVLGILECAVFLFVCVLASG